MMLNMYFTVLESAADDLCRWITHFNKRFYKFMLLQVVYFSNIYAEHSLT